MDIRKTPQIGQFVKVRQGRDQSKVAVIVGIADTRYVLIADGDKRKFDQPKRKKSAPKLFSVLDNNPTSAPSISLLCELSAFWPPIWRFAQVRTEA